MATSTRDWDAVSYQRVSVPHEEWAKAILARLNLADHDLLFRRLRATLKPGGRFAAQCGGAGNIADLRERTAEIAAGDPYAPFLGDFKEPWNYADAAETEARLKAAGFDEVRCWLQPWEILPPEPAEFLRTVCLGPYVDLLPDELSARFVDEVLAAEPSPLRMGYVRLNIEAVAGGGQ